MSGMVSRDRIERRLAELAAIGSNPSGGVTRLAYSAEENRAFDYLREELPDGLAVDEDSIGNLIVRSAPAAEQSIFLGSHLDSVYNGGRLDGALGVITALEAVQTVFEGEEEPAFPPTLTVFRAEESARFGQHTVGSRGALGMLTVDDFSATDQNDVPLWQGMQQAGFQPGDLAAPSIDTDRVAAFLEVHIEQGRVLEEADTRLGIVTSIRAPVRYRLTVTGEYDHSGATPMDLRHDALAAAAELLSGVESVGREAAETGDLVATVGDITAVDGAINTVCGEVTFPLDLRSNDEAYRDSVEARLRDEIDAVADERAVDVEWELLDRSEPVMLDDHTVDFLGDAANSISTARRLPSGGGHDAMNFQRVGVPTGMVFTPSYGGISHNPAEETDPEAVVDAAQLLTHTLLELPERNQSFSKEKLNR